eukprot:COSAG01_NODE_14840_length_1404_cov_0.938697_1_plen_392_part_10
MGPVHGPGGLTIHSISGEFVYTSARLVGNFSCSDGDLNNIHGMILPAMKSNLQGIFTDCPHRCVFYNSCTSVLEFTFVLKFWPVSHDVLKCIVRILYRRERLGWLEQSWLLAKSVGHNFDISTLYAKIANDMAEAQTPEGMVPDIAPEYVKFAGGFRDSPEWGMAFPMVVNYLHQEYNDTNALTKHYSAMRKYMMYLASKADKTGVIAYGLGDWTMVQKSPLGVTATMVFVEGCQNMARLAAVLHKNDDAMMFKNLATKSSAGYDAKFYDPKTGGYGTQTGTAMPLALGVAKDPAAATKWLVNSIATANNHSLTGEIGWPYLVRAFSMGPEVAVLQAMLHKKDAPSYLYQYLQGATTRTEQWDADRTASWCAYPSLSDLSSTPPLFLVLQLT